MNEVYDCSTHHHERRVPIRWRVAQQRARSFMSWSGWYRSYIARARAWHLGSVARGAIRARFCLRGEAVFFILSYVNIIFSYAYMWASYHTPPAVGPWCRRNFIPRRPNFRKNQTGLPDPNPKPTPAWLSGSMRRRHATTKRHCLFAEQRFPF